MQKLAIILGSLLLCSLAANAQTQRIAHRSHSGNNKSFTITKKENWGLGPEQIKFTKLEKLRIDSIAKKSHQADSARIAALKQLNKNPAKKAKVKSTKKG